MALATLSVRQDEPIGTISPRLYGHFAEHLGRCCYDGLWVGLDQNDLPHVDGFRADVVEALQSLPVPMLRWPGGCYADHYHWRDGIGPAGDRPVRLGMSCGLQVEDTNSLGTHEFLRLCAMLGAEPYLAGNVGSGSPQELCDWVEYCNTSVNTSLARERAANGSPEPFSVRLWGVGNENWGCGGNMDAAIYAHEYRRYATMLRHVDPRAELVLCGHDDAWNATVLDTVGDHLDLVDHLSIHRYWTHGGPETDYTDDDYYALLAEARATEDFIATTADLVHEATSGTRQIGIALDEWGVWHPEARPWGPGEVARRDPVTYEQTGTLRDALAAALALEGFHRQCHVLTLANLAQIVNVLQAVVMTDGDRIWQTTTYHALRLHAAHIGATALPVDISGGASLPDGTPAATATASVGTRGHTITVINQHLSQPAEVQIPAFGSDTQPDAWVLTAGSPRAANTAANPNHVTPIPLPVSADGPGAYRIDLPPHSMATVILSP